MGAARKCLAADRAGASFSTSLRAPDALSPWPGLAVMATWVIVAYVFAGVLLHRRDA
ncbi:hypothetical protein [Nocardioides ungokensis]|uniref:hypothetical protein n=1 Tax=Nocardioides ungokensis TaxID=1643322 RepID=UPI0015DDD49D|nr:hypothetical protein [Nocardioides ungokensis]